MIINHGVRGSVPTTSKKTSNYGGSTPCVEFLTKKAQIIFDCGSGFSKVNFNNDLPSIILLSHLHHDHIQGLPFNSSLLEKSKHILISSALINKNELKKSLKNYFSPPFFPVNFFEEMSNLNFIHFDDLVNEFRDLDFKSLNLNHPGNASGYSLEINNQKYCYLLDNEFYEKQMSSLKSFCENANSVIWDGMYTEDEIKFKVGWGHSSIEQGLIFAEKLDLKKLIISHHSPERTDRQIDDFKKKYSDLKIEFASENEE